MLSCADMSRPASPFVALEHVRLNVSPEFGLWFSGLFDGEGSFGFRESRCGKNCLHLKAKVALRRDDRAVLEYISCQFAVGRIFDNQYRPDNLRQRNVNPWSEFRVQRIADLAEVVVPFFESYPLRTKKAIEFRIWKKLVNWRYFHQRQTPLPQEQVIFDRIFEWLEPARDSKEAGYSPLRDVSRIEALMLSLDT